MVQANHEDPAGPPLTGLREAEVSFTIRLEMQRIARRSEQAGIPGGRAACTEATGLILLVGVRAECRFLSWSLQRHVDAADLVSEPCLAPRLVILGDAAIAALSPRVLIDWLGSHACPVILWRQHEGLRHVVPWMQAGFTDLAEDRDIEVMVERLLLLSAVGIRRIATTQAWFHGAIRLGGDGQAVLDAISRLRCAHDVAELAAELGWSRSRLVRVCGRDLNLTPGHVMRCFARFVLEDARRHGTSLQEIARMLGYQSAGALWRLRGAREGSLPGHGPG